MLKFLLITFIFCYIIYKIGGYLLRFLFWSLSNRHQQGHTFKSNNKPGQNSKKEGDINIDFIPNNGKEKVHKEKEFKGGEYVDYEELK